MPGTNSSSGSGGSSKAKEATSAKKPEGRGGGVAVTAEDLALREDICYQIFGDVGPLIRDFSCAWDHKVVMHGRMYVTERRLCFYANFFGLEAKMSLRHDDIARCNKGNSAIFIPNVVVVQDKSGKDFVFRAFWERDECHSLLEKLRVEADELRVRAEEFRARAEELRAETGRDGSVGGDEMSAPERAPGSGFAVSYDGEEDSAGFGDNDEQSGQGSGGAENTPEDLPTTPTTPLRVSPRRRVGENGPSTLPREDSCSPSEASSGRGDSNARLASTPPPPLAVGVRPSSSLPPPQYRGTGGSSASLPSSPNASSAAAAAAAAAGRGRSYSLTPGGGGGGGGDGSLVRSATTGGTGGIAPPRPVKLGLAVLGADHDVPSPPPPLYLNGDGGIGGGSAHGRLLLLQQQQQQQRQQQQRPSPRGTAVITGAGRAGWGSPLPGVNTPNGHYGSGGAGASVTDRRPSLGSTAGSADPGGEAGEEEGGDGNNEKGGTKQQQGGGEEEREQGGERKAGLVRRGSNLWSMMMGGRAGAGEEDPTADRKAMEEAINAGGDNHSEVATAEFDISVKEFYERFFADDAPYGLPDFHMSRGDWEVDADEWQQTAEEGEGGTAGAKEAGKGGGGTKAGSAGGGGFTRAIRFKTPLHITFMSSPGQVRTLKRQRCRFFGRQGCVVETQTTVEDRIPLSDNFHVEDRWIIRPATAGKDGRRSCTATVTWRCVWHKFTVIKGLIEGKARADVKSFNIAFLEGMREHLVEEKVPVSGGLNRRSSFRDSLLSASGGGGGGGGGRRASRDRSLSGRSLLSSFAGSDTGEGVSLSALGVEDRPRGFDRCLPAIRVFSILFILYISLFWVRYQMRDGGEWRRGAGGGFAASKDDLMRLYGEWGRSSLALLDVREEAHRLSAELLQLGPRGRSGSSGGKDMDSRRLEGEAVERLLREIEEKVSGMSQRADSALATLDVTSTQIRDAMGCPCPPATINPAAAAGDERDCAARGGGVCAAAAT